MLARSGSQLPLPSAFLVLSAAQGHASRPSVSVTVTCRRTELSRVRVRRACKPGTVLVLSCVIPEIRTGPGAPHHAPPLSRVAPTPHHAPHITRPTRTHGTWKEFLQIARHTVNFTMRFFTRATHKQQSTRMLLCAVGERLGSLLLLLPSWTCHAPPHIRSPHLRGPHTPYNRQTETHRGDLHTIHMRCGPTSERCTGHASANHDVHDA